MDKEIELKPTDNESEIQVLELMIKHYEERGGGYSQKEALKCAIKSLRHPVLQPIDVGEIKKFYIDREFPEDTDRFPITHDNIRWVEKFAKALASRFGKPVVDFEDVLDAIKDMNIMNK